MTTARFETSEFKRSHGKAPRGTGAWAFRPDTTGEWVFSPCMTFTEAKKWVREQHPEAKVFAVGP